MNKQKIMVSGIQPTNSITIGNYLGAIKNFVALQNEYKMYIFIADLHAITTNNNLEINKNKANIAKIYLASGLDPKKVVIFNQSDVIEHTMLGHILLCHTTLGELNRMTQFKDKSTKCKQSNGTDFIPTGLLTYPTLMAADILLYDADVVIVGNDQKQHIELTRNIAERLNNLYKKKIFTIPEYLTNSTTTRIMDLIDPTKKMSKSSENKKGVIFLNDDIDIARKKIMSSLTDNYNKVKYDVINQPGISNLINIYSGFTNKKIEEIEKEFSNIKNYGEFKSAVADSVCNFLEQIQKKVIDISDDQISKILIDGSKKAELIAKDKIAKVLEVMRVK